MKVLLQLRLESINEDEVTIINPNDIYDDTLLGIEQLISKIISNMNIQLDCTTGW
jgi:hypothetical protein